MQFHSQASASDESSPNASQDGVKTKSKEEAKSTKSKSKSGSSSSKKSSGGGGISAKHKSTASLQHSSAVVAANPLSSLSLPMLPPEFAQPFALPSPFSSAAQLLRPHFPATSAASSAPAEQLIRLPTKPLDISEVSKNPAVPTKKPDATPPPPSKKSFEDAECVSGTSGGGKRDNVVKVPPFSNRQQGAIVVESNNNEVVGKREENGGISNSKEQFAVLRYVALVTILSDGIPCTYHQFTGV